MWWDKKVLREIWNNSLELSLFHFYLLVEYLFLLTQDVKRQDIKVEEFITLVKRETNMWLDLYSF